MCGSGGVSVYSKSKLKLSRGVPAKVRAMLNKFEPVYWVLIRVRSYSSCLMVTWELHPLSRDQTNITENNTFTTPLVGDTNSFRVCDQIISIHRVTENNKEIHRFRSVGLFTPVTMIKESGIGRLIYSDQNECESDSILRWNWIECAFATAQYEQPGKGSFILERKRKRRGKRHHF